MSSTPLLDPWRTETGARATTTAPSDPQRVDLPAGVVAPTARPPRGTPRLCFSELPAADGPCREHGADRYLSHREHHVDGGLGRYVFVHEAALDSAGRAR